MATTDHVDPDHKSGEDVTNVEEYNYGTQHVDGRELKQVRLTLYQVFALSSIATHYIHTYSMNRTIGRRILAVDQA